MACFLGCIILDCARGTAKGTPLTIWNVKFSWDRNGVILSHIQSPKIAYSCNRNSISFLRNTSIVMLEGNSQLAPDEISQHEHQVSKTAVNDWNPAPVYCLLWVHPYQGAEGCKKPGSPAWRREGTFSGETKTSTTTRRWKKSFCLMGRLISFDILILEVEGFWYQKMRLWEGVGCCQHL